MRSLLKYGLYFIIVGILIYIGNTFMYRLLIPDCIRSPLETVKENKLIMARIGGYKDFKSSFEDGNYNDNQPANFELSIFGESSGVVLKGIIIKTNGECNVIKVDTSFVNYE